MKTVSISVAHFISYSGSRHRCIFEGAFKNNTADKAIVVGCIGDETAINIAHRGGINEFTVKNDTSQQSFSKWYTPNARDVTVHQEGNISN